jgi:hypothetical protein
MARITIKDLPQSDDLDREAMRSILGGGLSGARPQGQNRGGLRQSEIVDYPLRLRRTRRGEGRAGPHLTLDGDYLRMFRSGSTSSDPTGTKLP